MVQNSKALSGVKSIRAFLKENHPDNTNELGIGDRHLDNIMIDVYSFSDDF